MKSELTVRPLDSYMIYAVHNGHGDIVALTDASGNILVTYQYDTWGNLVGHTDNSGVGLAMANPYRYADYRYDDTVGLYYLMARWYDPTIGRFLSQDSHSTLPNYIYGANNPISYIDPTGYDLMSILNNVAEGLDQLGNALMCTTLGVVSEDLSIGVKALGEAVEEVPKVVSEIEKGVEEAYTAGKNFVEETLGGSSAKYTSQVGINRNIIPRITSGSLPKSEGQEVLRTMQHIDNGTKPSGAAGVKWGTTFKNTEGNLPQGTYNEYRVIVPGMPNTLRIVKNFDSGNLYYTWTHYGTAGNPPFVLIR